MSQPTEYDVKIILIGPVACGKTSILIRFLRNQFFQITERTVGVDFGTKSITLDDNTVVNIKALDSAGEENLAKQAVPFYRFTDGCFLVYDISSAVTFSSLDRWLKTLYENVGDKKPIVTLIGNKADLAEKKRRVHNDENSSDLDEDDAIYVSKEAGQKYAEEHGLNFFETSALTSANINEAFVDMVTKIVAEKCRIAALKNEEETKTIDISDSDKGKKSKKKDKKKEKNVKDRKREGGCMIF